MNWLKGRLHDEKGLVLAITMIILGIFTILGASAIVFSTTEMQVAANEKFYKIAFYGAEAGRGYVPKNTDLYGMDNIAPFNPLMERCNTTVLQHRREDPDMRSARFRHTDTR
jgi:hypothetical protein